MLLEIRKHIVEETISLNPAFDYEGLDEEVAQALLNLAYYGERHRGAPDALRSVTCQLVRVHQSIGVAHHRLVTGGGWALP